MVVLAPITRRGRHKLYNKTEKHRPIPLLPNNAPIVKMLKQAKRNCCIIKGEEEILQDEGK
jgi:hypothetical protein